jgi:hypothetical protein
MSWRITRSYQRHSLSEFTPLFKTVLSISIGMVKRRGAALRYIFWAVTETVIL